MKSPAIKLIPLLVLTLIGGRVFAASESKAEASFRFGGMEYFHRWSKDDQHEFTPRDQEDLKRWTDMVTLHRYRNIRDGEALAAQANATLEVYKGNRGMVLRTDSVPRTPEKPAEYLIVVLFPQPDFIEAVFARFKIVGGRGTSAIYSHREYGKKIGDQMSAWLKANGPTTEKALMSWEYAPPPEGAKE